MAKRTRFNRTIAQGCAALLLAIAAPSFAVDAPTPPPLPEKPAYKDLSLSFEKRAADLVTYMTLDEKATQLQVAVPANPRLGIPASNWWTEGLHGISGRGNGNGRGGQPQPQPLPANPGTAPTGNPNANPVATNTGAGTVFPDAMAMAAMWDPPLLREVASAISDEARAKYVPTSARAIGLMLWCPTMNIARDPRWGRTAETFGEDPYLLSRLGVAYVKGIQGDDPKYLKAVATPKHFAVYNQENSRNTRNDIVSQRSLYEYYLPPFQACFVEGHAQSTMAAYNAINGVPCAANQWLLTEVLRDKWGFDGAVVSDSGAVAQIQNGHGFKPTLVEAAAAAINAGCDIITGSPPPTTVIQAYHDGLIKPEALDKAVLHTLLVRFRLGLFDPPDMVPFTKIPLSVVGSKEHLALALKSARESITLLKNDAPPKGLGFDQLLPLDLRKINSIAVVGPYARVLQYGSYGGTPANYSPTPLEAITAAVGDRIQIHTGNTPDEWLKAAADSDVVIVFAGLNSVVERASIDRPNFDVPAEQKDFLNQVVKVNPLTVLCLEGGSSINLEIIKEKFPAILMLWYSGEQGSVAAADVLFGKYNPAGRLPLTFYRSYEDLPPMEDYEVMHGRTYMYCQKPVTYPFGYGLSYTTFSYATLKVTPPPTTTLESTITVTVNVTNTGTRDGEEVVQLYAHKTDSAMPRPIKQLVAFQRVMIPKGYTQQVRFSVPLSTVAYWDTDKHAFAIEPGTHEFMAGGSSGDLQTQATVDF